MAPSETREALWVVVKVESGIPVMAEAYRDQRSAELREMSLRGSINLENDETGVSAVRPYGPLPKGKPSER